MCVCVRASVSLSLSGVCKWVSARLSVSIFSLYLTWCRCCRRRRRERCRVLVSAGSAAIGRAYLGGARGWRERETNGQRVHAWGKRQRETREGGEVSSERGREGGEERERQREIDGSDTRLGSTAARMRSRRQRRREAAAPPPSYGFLVCRNFCGISEFLRPPPLLGARIP